MQDLQDQGDLIINEMYDDMVKMQKAIDSICVQKLGLIKNFAGMFKQCKDHGMYGEYPRLGYSRECPWCELFELSSIEEVRNSLKNK